MSLAEARRFAGVPLKLSRVSADVFDALLQESYEQGSHQSVQMVDGLDEDFDLTQVAQELQEPSDLLESDDDAPIIRFINAVLTEAIKENASDVHIEPYENRLGVRFRVDGVLREVLQTRRALAPLVVSRIKVMSKLDIAEKRCRRMAVFHCALPVEPSMFVCRRCHRATASALCCACSINRPDVST